MVTTLFISQNLNGALTSRWSGAERNSTIGGIAETLSKCSGCMYEDSGSASALLYRGSSLPNKPPRRKLEQTPGCEVAGYLVAAAEAATAAAAEAAEAEAAEVAAVIVVVVAAGRGQED